jgi:hypothetical protein
MDLMRARVALRERPLLDVLDLAVRFCAAHAGAYAKMSAAVLVPAFAVSWAAGHLVNWWLGWTVTVTVTAFAGAPFVALASRLVFAESVGTGEALRIALRAVPGLIGVRILQAMALGASLVMAGLPWIWLGTILLFVVEVLVLEGSGAGGTLGRAQRIANAHFSDAALTMLLLALAPVSAAMLADVAGREVLKGVLEVKPPPSMFREGGSWLALLGWWATLPLLQTARFFVYLDIRTRTEGWDIQTRFAAIAARADAERQEQETLGAARAVRRRAAPGVVAGGMALLAMLAVLSVSRPAHAVLDPTRAQTDVDASMKEGGYPFCRAPRTPISYRARELCPHASAIPDCAGFSAECTTTTTTTPPSSGPSWRWPWSSHPLAVPGFLGTLAQVLVWLLVAALVLAILVPIVRAIARIKREDSKKEKKPERTLPLDEEPAPSLPMITDEEALLARAGELARAGRLADALQTYLAAGLRALDKRGAVRLARDRTNGEYVRACSDGNAKPALRDIVREVDRVQFGGEAPTMDAVTRAARASMAIVRALPAALAALAFACLLGCGGGGGGTAKVPRPGDDPAGQELFRDVLRRQGVHATALETALASMPLPKAGERGPAVVVDLEKTDLDDETRDHLVEWVDAGGVLVLAGNTFEWPKKFGASTAFATGPHKITARRLLARSVPAEPGEEDDESEEEKAIYARTTEKGELAGATGLTFSGASERVAWFDDSTTYAAVLEHGKGFVLAIASNELMTNAGLARPGNAAVMVSILSSADRLEMRLADAEDGVSPPSTPIAALLRAGLGTGLAHGLVACVVLFLAVGVRLARPKPSPPPRRRAFAEHVEAVGALYARTRNAPHALAAFSRFADDRLRARMPRGSPDVAAFLASRARLPLDTCQRLWARAVQAKAGAPPLGDELAVLRELSAVYTAATEQDT